MDDPTLHHDSHDSALRALGRINRISRSLERIIKTVQKKATSIKSSHLKVLDIASGGGDLALGLSKYAKHHGLSWEVHGADISQHAVDYANEKARELQVNTEFFRLDAVNQPLPSDYDVIMSHLFIHHLSEEEVSKLFENMGRSVRQLILIDDLIRSNTGYWMAWMGCRLVTRSKVVHHDGPASVKSAFRIQEIAQIANQSGLLNHQITKHWPERFMMTWSPK
ncbi:MAG: hypothetical protein RJA81_1893 [Planctomycetota bacterium]